MMTEQRFEALVQKNGATPKTLQAFQDLILNYYSGQGRKDLPFRTNHSPYAVLVSEIMLQQTQVERGITKFTEFMEAFPTLSDLAAAPKAQLLRVWSGLGYNRRALALQRCAQIVVNDYKGILPNDTQKLIELPSIGPYTAGAIRAFAYNEPVTIIETNIRTVFIHFFFQGKKNVDDAKLLPLIEKTVHTKNARIWYYALMDYGVKLKREHPNPSRKSKTYTKQSAFKGSMREARGRVLKAIVAQPGITQAALIKTVQLDPARAKAAAQQLVQEGFASYKNRKYIII